jgi:Tfp pilus assembly protein PilF
MSNRFAETIAEGFTHLNASQYDQASQAFRRATLVDPSHAIGSYGVGFCHLRQSNWKDATRLLFWARVAARSTTSARISAEIHIALGHSQKSLGLFIDARRSLKRASVTEPANAQIYFNHSNCFDRAATGGSQARLATWAVAARPDAADYWNELGRSTTKDDALVVCVNAYRRALILNPAHPHGWNNLGVAHKRKDELVRGIDCFRRARAIHPGNSQALANLGRNLLLTEQFVEGWECLEAPWRSQGLQPRGGSFSLPVWDGSNLRGRRLLLWSEEKIGEEIMFSTMLDEIRRRSGPVTLLCNPRIAGLLSRALPQIDVKGWTGGVPTAVVLDDHAACYPLEFVGRFVRRSFQDFPVAAPLLASDFGDDPIGHTPACRRGRPRVGLHWRSANPLVGDYKSIALRDWGPILSVAGIDFVSLQYGPVTDEIAEVQELHGAAPTALVGIDQLVDMESFTNVVSNLDLIISISGTSAHVAGGLGRPTWLLLPRGPGLSWFWFEKRNASPWYANCLLYRQESVGVWRDVLEKVGKNLENWRQELYREGLDPAY